MEFTPIRPIEPLWTPAASQTGTQAQDPAPSLFASVFQSAIQNVRDTNAVQVDLEYQLATGQLDNPADLTLATSKATNAAILLMEMRNKALDAYNELMRISL
ncbi:MAG: flagellar hook-basal body complex protein FliE [Lawsonibacter sp.]|nr:flagellar hook-basal body complex protein FliE [Lawsonibacter sp.]